MRIFALLLSVLISGQAFAVGSAPTNDGELRRFEVRLPGPTRDEEFYVRVRNFDRYWLQPDSALPSAGIVSTFSLDYLSQGHFAITDPGLVANMTYDASQRCKTLGDDVLRSKSHGGKSSVQTRIYAKDLPDHTGKQIQAYYQCAVQVNF